MTPPVTFRAGPGVTARPGAPITFHLSPFYTIMRKIPLTISDHQKFASILYPIQTQSLYLYQSLADHFGKTSTFAVRMGKAASLIANVYLGLTELFFDSRLFDECVYDPMTDLPKLGNSDLAVVAKRLDEWRSSIGGILSRLYTALPVKAAVVNRLERAEKDLSWVEGSLRM
jgi:hypothetical protein